MSQAIILPQYPGDFSLDGHTHNYASASHSHSQYLTSHQSLTNYATKTYVDNAVAGIDTSTVPSHTHDYASSSHTHSYASTSHTHSGYASSSHSHSGYASSSHTHSSSDISGLSGGGGQCIDAGNMSFTGSRNFTKPANIILIFKGDGTTGNPYIKPGSNTYLRPSGHGSCEVSLSSDGLTLTIATTLSTVGQTTYYVALG